MKHVKSVRLSPALELLLMEDAEETALDRPSGGSWPFSNQRSEKTDSGDDGHTKGATTVTSTRTARESQHCSPFLSAVRGPSETKTEVLKRFTVFIVGFNSSLYMKLHWQL